jgi:D-alanyl-D-alanine dipeptidase
MAAIAEEKTSWRDVAISDCGEPLIVVNGEDVSTCSIYYARGYEEALPYIWLREDAATRVLAAAALLPPGLTLVLWDGWRPLSLQKRLYDSYKAVIARSSGLSGEALERETLKLVSLPNADPMCPSTHLTGGSIDLTLADAEGVPLDMGGEFDEFGERSRTDFYERSRLSSAELIYRDRRRLLCALMKGVGFSNYAEEWWQFDIGNQFHHHRVGGIARYGAVLHLPEAGSL